MSTCARSSTDLRFAIEPKPNEPRGDILLPSIGHALSFIYQLEHPEMVGLNPEVGHENMACLNMVHGVAQALWAGKLFHIDLNGQHGPRYDQDLRFASADVKSAFFLVDLLETAGYDGPRHFDFKPPRAEGAEGVWVSAAGCMRNYLILRPRQRRAAPTRRCRSHGCGRLALLGQPTMAPGETLADLLATAPPTRTSTPTPRAAGNQHRAPRPARPRAHLRRALTRPSWRRGLAARPYAPAATSAIGHARKSASASSAAPSRTESAPSPAATTAASAPACGRTWRCSSAYDDRLGCQVHVPQRPSEDHKVRVEDIDQIGRAPAHPLAGLPHCFRCLRVACLGVRQHPGDTGPHIRSAAPGPPQHRRCPYLAFPTATSPATTTVTVRVHLHVTNLAGVTGPPREKSSVNNNAGSDAGIARDVDDVTAAYRRASGAFSQRTQVRFVGNGNAEMVGEVARKECTEGHVPPDEIGCQVHKPLAAPYDPGDCDRSPDELSAGWYVVHQLTSKGANGLGSLGRGQLAARVARLSETFMEMASGTDPGDDQSLRSQLDGKHPDPLSVEADDQRRAPGSAPGRRWALAYQTDGRQLADEARDRAPVEPCPCRQLRTRERPAQVQVADECGQVVTPQVLLYRRVEPAAHDCATVLRAGVPS